MQAIAIAGGKGPASALHLAQIETPQPKPGEILIRVRAAGVNRPDLKQREGAYPPPPGAPQTLGLEVAGVVVTAAGLWREGDQVCALLGGGGYAQYAVVDARHALPLPAGLDFVAAAALPETAFTVYVNLFEHGALQSWRDAADPRRQSAASASWRSRWRRPRARASSRPRVGRRRPRNARRSAPISPSTRPRRISPPSRSAAGGVDVVIDIVGASYFAGNIDALNRKGRLVLLSTLGGNDASCRSSR